MLPINEGLTSQKTGLPQAKPSSHISKKILTLHRRHRNPHYRCIKAIKIVLSQSKVQKLKREILTKPKSGHFNTGSRRCRQPRSNHHRSSRQHRNNHNRLQPVRRISWVCSRQDRRCTQQLGVCHRATGRSICPGRRHLDGLPGGRNRYRTLRLLRGIRIGSWRVPKENMMCN